MRYEYRLSATIETTGKPGILLRRKFAILNLHRVLPLSKANGPGTRFVVWFQGCPLRCTGCFNPETHSTEPRILMPESALILLMKRYSDRIEGVTFSGGEPMFQSAGLLGPLQSIRRETRLSVLLYSGHTVAEIIAKPHGEQILQLVDVLVSGRYDQTTRSNDSLVSSSNQKMHFLTSRYGTAEKWSEGEMFIDAEGMVVVSGVQVPFMQ